MAVVLFFLKQFFGFSQRCLFFQYARDMMGNPAIH
jgi:hypothetical protein